jgi:hypothetical protein
MNKRKRVLARALAQDVSLLTPDDMSKVAGGLRCGPTIIWTCGTDDMTNNTYDNDGPHPSE